MERQASSVIAKYETERYALQMQHQGDWPRNANCSDHAGKKQTYYASQHTRLFAPKKGKQAKFITGAKSIAGGGGYCQTRLVTWCLLLSAAMSIDRQTILVYCSKTMSMAVGLADIHCCSFSTVAIDGQLFCWLFFVQGTYNLVASPTSTVVI